MLKDLTFHRFPTLSHNGLATHVDKREHGFTFLESGVDGESVLEVKSFYIK